MREEGFREVDDSPAAAFNTEFGNSGWHLLWRLLTFCFANASSFHFIFHSLLYVIPISFLVSNQKGLGVEFWFRGLCGLHGLLSSRN